MTAEEMAEKLVDCLAYALELTHALERSGSTAQVEHTARRLADRLGGETYALAIEIEEAEEEAKARLRLKDLVD